MSGYYWNSNEGNDQVISETSKLNWKGLQPSKFSLNHTRRIIRPPDELGLSFTNRPKPHAEGKKHIQPRFTRGNEERWRPSLKPFNVKNLSMVFSKPEVLPNIRRERLIEMSPHLFLPRENANKPKKMVKKPLMYSSASAPKLKVLKETKNISRYPKNTDMKIIISSRNLEILTNSNFVCNPSFRFKGPGYILK